MGVKSKALWKALLPFNLFWFLLALIGLWKTHTLWGFVLLAASIGLTAMVAWFVDKREAGKRDD